MSEIKSLIEIDWKTFIQTLFIAVAGFLAIRKLLVELYKIIGIVPPWKKEDDKMKRRISQMESTLNDLQAEHRIDKEKLETMIETISDTQDEVLTAIKDIKKEVTDSNIEQMRYAILEFANNLRRYEYGKEAFDHIMEVHTRYLQILKDNDMTNGRVDAAMSFINEKYDEFMRKGFPY